MIKRYPDIGKIIISTEIDDAGGVPTLTTTEIEVIGRYEPLGQQRSLDYSAKFFCKPNGISAFEVDGQQFIYEGKQFKITSLINYQSYCEIWLE